MKNLFALLFFGLLITAISCEKDQEFNDLTELKNSVSSTDISQIQQEGIILNIPEATVKKSTKKRVIDRSRNSVCPDPLTPPLLEATVVAGTSFEEIKYVCAPPISPIADILYTFDLTGSMIEEIANIKANCNDIADAIMFNIPQARSGVVTHKDYPGTFTSCGYSNTYGGGSDFPFSLDVALTTDMGAVHSAIDGLPALVGGGADLPENYTRILWEAYTNPQMVNPNPLIGWRDDAMKVVMMWGDDVPHDCDLPIIGSTGAELGPDGAVGGGDDLVFAQVLQDLENEEIHLIVIFSGDTENFPSIYDDKWDMWQDIAANYDYVDVHKINADGTILGGFGTLSDFIIKAIEDSAPPVEELTLEVEGTEYDSWVTFSPAVIEDPLTNGYVYEVNVLFEVPVDAELTTHTFDIILYRDGIEIGRQEVIIEVIPFYVPVDIKPTSCRNPINLKSGGVVSVAINGWREFDVRRIDPSTVTLAGVEPMRHSYEDVSAPYWPFIGKVGAFDCTTEGPDGFMDLVFKFNKKDLIEAIGDAVIGDVLVLPLEGLMYSGVPIYGEDVVQVVNKSKT